VRQHPGDALVSRSGCPGFNRRTQGPAVLLGWCCEMDQKMKVRTLRKRQGGAELLAGLTGFRRASKTRLSASPAIARPGEGLADPSNRANRVPVYGALVSHSC